MRGIAGAAKASGHLVDVLGKATLRPAAQGHDPTRWIVAQGDGMGLRQSLERLDGWERSRSAVIVGDYSVCASCSATLVKIGGLPISPRRRFRQVGGVAAGLPFGAGATRLAAHHGQAVAVAVAFQVIAVAGAVAGQSAVPCGGRGGLGTAAAADEFRRSRCVQSPATGAIQRAPKMAAWQEGHSAPAMSTRWEQCMPAQMGSR